MKANYSVIVKSIEKETVLCVTENEEMADDIKNYMQSSHPDSEFYIVKNKEKKLEQVSQ
jgi:hypothetical protein